MKKLMVIISLILAVSMLMACAKTGKESIAENEGLTRILGNGAAGIGGARDGEKVADLPDVNDVNMRSNGSEGAYYFKLVDGVDTVLDAGEYTVGMADNLCTVTVRDADGNTVDSVSISAQGDGGKSPIKSAANITVPEGGSAMSVGGTCVAQMKQ